jgi:HEAT repeat protein
VSLFPLALLASLFLAVDEPTQVIEEAQRQAAEDIRTLQAARLPTDGPGLVRFFQKQIMTEPDEKDISRLIHALADKSFKIRERAAMALTSCGPAVLPLLRRGLAGTDLEVRLRLERCIRLIENRRSGAAIWGAAARRLEALRPDGACSALLAYLPSAGEQVQEETLASLLTLGARDGKLDPAVVMALTDPAPARRGAAAFVFAWHGDAQQRDAVRRLLRTDPEPKVVLRAAEGLLAVGEVAPIPVLLAMIAAGDDERALCADDLLRWAAGRTAPVTLLRLDSPGRRECHAAWQAWWQWQKDRIHLPRRQQAALTPLAKRAARQTTQRFLQAVCGADLRALRRLTEFPVFAWTGGYLERITDSRRLDVQCQIMRKLGPEWAVTRVLQLSDYLMRRAPPEYHHLLDLSGSRLCIAFAKLPLGPDVMMASVFVRVAHGQARVVGVERFAVRVRR